MIEKGRKHDLYEKFWEDTMTAMTGRPDWRDALNKEEQDYVSGLSQEKEAQEIMIFDGIADYRKNW